MRRTSGPARRPASGGAERRDGDTEPPGGRTVDRRRSRLLRSTPLRLALTYGVLFVVSLLAVSMATFWALRAEFYSNLDRTVRETYEIVASSYDVNDAEDLVATVSNFSRFRKSEQWVFYLESPGGGRLAGNIAQAPQTEGLVTITASALGLPDGVGRFRVTVGKVAGNRLAVGQNLSETEGLAQILLINFGWATALAVLAALVTGLFLARRAQARLDRIAETMHQVSDGRLDNRIRLVGTGDDIDVVASQINGALDRLSNVVESMRQVSTDIAHDLKTPLNRLRLILEEAVAQNARRQDVAESLEEALVESDKINATFEALLRIAQIESGARKARFLPQDLGGIMRSIAEIYADVAEDNGQTLVFAEEMSASVPVQGDRELLTQLFVNLVENAINHNPDGTRITLKLWNAAGNIIASVCDNGAGIPEGEREKVFRRLYRLDTSRTTPGNGLGLSLVRAVADLHGFSVSIADNGPGTCVQLVVPLQQVIGQNMGPATI